MSRGLISPAGPIDPRGSPLESALRLTLQPPSGAEGNVPLGWFLAERSQGPVFYHGGRTGGFRSFVGFDLRQQRGVVVLANSIDGIDDLGWHILDPSAPLTTVRAPATLPPEALLEYVGTYGMPTDRPVRIRLDGDHLVVQVPGLGTFNIYPWMRDEFFARVGDVLVRVERDGEGRVTALRLRAGCTDMPPLARSPVSP